MYFFVCGYVRTFEFNVLTAAISRTIAIGAVPTHTIVSHIP